MQISRAHETLMAIADLVRQGHPPRTRELLIALRLKNVSSLSHLLSQLEDEGLITIFGGGRGSQRVVELTPKGRGAAQMGFPVLGRIPAGPMMLAESEVIEWIDPGDTLQIQPGDFFLPVVGDSMIGDGIFDGDRVQIRPNVIVANGQIAAVAEVQEGSGDHLATLKRVFHSPGKRNVRLKASNPKYEDIILPASRVVVAGAYRGLIRSLE